jgi:cytochrome c oxidase subunit 2
MPGPCRSRGTAERLRGAPVAESLCPVGAGEVKPKIRIGTEVTTMKTKTNRVAGPVWSRLGAAAIGLGALLASTAALAVDDLPGGPGVLELNLQTPVTAIAREQLWLHNMMLILCTVIFIGVFGVMFYSILKHRKSLGHKAANFHESVKVEIAWTVVPFIIVILMALPATKTVVAMKDTTNADLTVKVTGYQWKWGYDYIKGEGEGIGFLSTLDTTQREASEAGRPSGDDYLLKVDNPLVVPVNKKIRIITTANDVIHSWGVPAFGVKQDAIPGFVRDTWFRADKVGDYHGQCVELCGKEHAFMPIWVKVVSAEDYTKWVDGKKKAMAAAADDPNKTFTHEELMARGQQVFAAHCVACHGAQGQGGVGKKLDGSPIVDDADPMKQIETVLNGRNQMPAWKGQLSPTEIASVITYTKNSWSNHTGQTVQPAQIVAATK